MRTLYKLGIGFIMLLIISVGLLSFWWQGQEQEMYERNYMSHYDYDAILYIYSPLNNVTLYVPLPTMNNTSCVGQKIVNNSYRGPRSEWKTALVETEHGLMLSLKTDHFEPHLVLRGEGPDTYPMPLSFSTGVSPEHTIDTRDPINNEPLLAPKYNLTYLGKTTSQRDADAYRYEGRVYAYYDTSPNTTVTMDVHMGGTNEWAEAAGWPSNNYRDYIRIELSGPQNGWIAGEGELVTGEGTYRDQ